MNTIKEDARYIIERSIETVLPEKAVFNSLESLHLPGKTFLLAIGKAAWRMAKAAREKLGQSITAGVIITKYGHVEGDIPGIDSFEAGHPLPDENTIAATTKALEMINAINPDSILFLISGGGSALFEKPVEGVTLDDLVDINNRLLRSGANIVEINAVRKRLSVVKGGRFAKMFAQTTIHSLDRKSVV